MLSFIDLLPILTSEKMNRGVIKRNDLKLYWDDSNHLWTPDKREATLFDLGGNEISVVMERLSNELNKDLPVQKFEFPVSVQIRGNFTLSKSELGAWLAENLDMLLKNHPQDCHLTAISMTDQIKQVEL